MAGKLSLLLKMTCMIFLLVSNHFVYGQPAEGRYYIKNVGANKSLDADAGNVENSGCKVQLWNSIPVNKNQQWYIDPAAGGKFTIRNVLSASEKVLNVQGGILTRGGVAIELSNKTSSEGQLWTFVRSYDSAVVKENMVDLRLNQSALKTQAPYNVRGEINDRGGCTYFGNMAILEAAYKKRGYGELDLSEEFFSTMAKLLYIHPYWNEIANSNYRENQLGGLQGGGSADWFSEGLRIPLERNVPFRNSFESPSYWDTRDQRLANDFNNALLSPGMIKSPLYYGALGTQQISPSLQRNSAEYERLLDFGFEIDVDLDVAHNVVIVGYDKTIAGSPVFLVKDSYETPGTRCVDECNRTPYSELMGTISNAHYITAIREPAPFPELAFLGTWKLNFDGHRARLDIYHIPGISTSVLQSGRDGGTIRDKRIGVLYDESGKAFRINGTITGNRINFFLDMDNPNLRWDELKGRSFSYVLESDQNIMSGFHQDGDGRKYGGYATKGEYLAHSEATPGFPNLTNSNWNLKWGNKTGYVRFLPNAGGLSATGIFNYGGRSESVTITQTTGDIPIAIRMGTLNGSLKSLSHERGILCGSDAASNPIILYKQ